MTEKKQRAYRFGLAAERWAAFFLICKGYRILAMRYRNAGGEIDLLAARRHTLVAVEVKARRNLQECNDTVMPWKQQKIGRALEGWLAIHGENAGLNGARARNIRFDVIWVVRRRVPVHIKDAWRM